MLTKRMSFYFSNKTQTENFGELSNVRYEEMKNPSKIKNSS